MNPSGRSVGCSLALLAAGVLAVRGDESVVQGVSPGEAERAVEATSACPSFSWSAVAGASAYRVALFEIRADGAVEPVFTQRIEGAALSWTPPRERCLAPGREYAWVVRAERGSEETLGAWSRPLRFRVPGVPTVDEVRAALELLGRWQAAGNGTGEAGGSGSGSTGVEASGQRQGALQTEASSATGVASIRGENAATGGTSYGVFGISHSPLGAGVVARNETAGADLILDGEAQGQADTLLTQSGIDRPSASTQTFEIGNSGAGAMTLTVDGVAVDTATTPIGWARLTGVPAGFSDGIDNDTTYTAGNQLSLAGTQFNVLEGAGSGLDADTLDGAQGSSYQARVVGTCPGGQSMRGVNADGSVVCYEAPVPPRITTVDGFGNVVGLWTSIAIGNDGLPVISYYDQTAGSLKVAKCKDPSCANLGASKTTVDGPPNFVGQYSSLAVGPDGLPIISYHDVGNRALKVVKCNDPSCEGGDESVSTVDDPGLVGLFTSLALGVDSLPVISYFDQTAGSLKVAKCNDAACAGSNEMISTVDDPSSGNIVGKYSSLAIGADGFPVISYYDETAHALKVAKCNDVACAGSNELITFVDDPANWVGSYTSIVVGLDGYPVISYQDQTGNSLKVAKCNDAACTGSNESISTVDHAALNLGPYTSITLGLDGLPIISYQDVGARALRVAKCNDPACAGGDESITIVDDPTNWVGSYTAIAIGAEGFPVISYFDETANALKVAKCLNPSCKY